jgi:hypothetical protein
MRMCMHKNANAEGEWVCLKPEHEGDHEYSPIGALSTLSSFKLTCDHCSAVRSYVWKSMRVSLYGHGVCTVSFTCTACGRDTEVEVPDQVAIDLDRKGVPTTVVPVPEEVFERPAAEVPAIQAFDVELLERSSIEHFNERFRVELGSLESGG